MKEKGQPAQQDPRVAYFDRVAGGWDADAGRLGRTLERIEACRDLLDLRGGDDLLEVGCGTGQITAWLCSAVAPGRVVGIDFSAEMLAVARAKGIAAEFRLHDICDGAAERAGFDVALCFHSFPHFRDKPAALTGLAASLRPAGRLLVMHLSGSKQVNDMHTGFGGPVGQDHLPARRDWPGLLAPVGMKVAAFLDRDDLFFLRAVAG